eukprot:1181961-Prorocentrum_minimum.AAC.1
MPRPTRPTPQRTRPSPRPPNLCSTPNTLRTTRARPTRWKVRPAPPGALTEEVLRGALTEEVLRGALTGEVLRGALTGEVLRAVRPVFEPSRPDLECESSSSNPVPFQKKTPYTGSTESDKDTKVPAQEYCTLRRGVEPNDLV